MEEKKQEKITDEERIRRLLLKITSQLELETMKKTQLIVDLKKNYSIGN